MDVFDLLLNAGLVTAAVAAYLVLFREVPKKQGHYTQPGWNYPLKFLSARYAVRRWKKRLRDVVTGAVIEAGPRANLTEGWENVALRAAAPDGTMLLLGLRRLAGRQPIAEVTVHVQLPDGTTYRPARHPESAVGVWDSDGWSAGGLKVEVLDDWRMRVLYSGMMTRIASSAVNERVIRYVRINLIWCSASRVVWHPEEWSQELAAQALATEPWRNGNWAKMINRWNDGACWQWGSVQGRLQAYDPTGQLGDSAWLAARGVRERSWAPHGYQLYRSINILATARDGTAVNLLALSYKDALTQTISGTIRFSNSQVKPITFTDLNMIDFCEERDGIPSNYTINVGADGRHFKLVLHIGGDGRVLSGVPIQHEFIYRTLLGNINAEDTGGILELGYEVTASQERSFALSPARRLRWLSSESVRDVGYCVPFEEEAAACPQLVGGKCASLALLSSVQYDEGYRVPPGFCITIHAMERHLKSNPELKQAIKDIESVNENYEEQEFKDKCNIAAALFNKTVIQEDLKRDILLQLGGLRKKVLDQKLSAPSEMRFAVRSSAVGEDGEVLSAAGQNETVLGCSSDDDVLLALQRCWGSMFAFTSAHYRRQNGQPCACDAGVAVQALVRARAAGVLFTRHPDAGDPSRILITANYGLGESVVSGTVEPDTFVVSRDLDDHLSIASVQLGSKTKYIIPGNDGNVVAVDVPDEERNTACLSDADVLKLARIAVIQEELWGAPRDIEWAINEDGIYLLQARPITSLQRWTEEELLHETDWAVMSEEDMVTFANTGEVMPKPLTLLSQDLVTMTLIKAMYELFVGGEATAFDGSISLTHHRCVLNMYNTVYRNVEKELNMTIRMSEFAIHGHTVADDRIHGIALRRRPPNVRDKIAGIALLLKSLIWSKWYVKDSLRRAKQYRVDIHDNASPLDVIDAIEKSKKYFGSFCVNHGYTSTASSASQIIAMSVLLEGAKEFSPEQCQELGMMMACGEAVSAEVPLALAALARELSSTDRNEEFRAQPPTQALQWLRLNLPHVHLDVVTFLEKHGHRAVMEFDLATKPWSLAPENMMETLQAMHAYSSKETQAVKSDDQIISSLVTPKKRITKRILRWLIPLCRRAVAHRESTKASLILAIHKMRLATRHLGKLMVREWLLPDAELVFYFRYNELRTYLQSRDPALLRKAIQRRQYYPKWASMQFPEVIEGWPQPIIRKSPQLTAAGARIVATPVCAGDIVARACVVHDLSEIGVLKQGDILITHCTDIGWSPYFPLLAGIVTELGGLISHGAVIAREYGLPCVVGAMGATDIFRTGDMVHLSGVTGVIEKVEIGEEEAQNEDKEKSGDVVVDSQ